MRPPRGRCRRARLTCGGESSTACLVAPDPATSPFWGAGPVRLTLTAEAEKITDTGRVPRPHRRGTTPHGTTKDPAGCAPVRLDGRLPWAGGRPQPAVRFPVDR